MATSTVTSSVSLSRRKVAGYSLSLISFPANLHAVFTCQHTASGQRFTAVMLPLSRYVEVASTLNLLVTIPCTYLTSIVDVRHTRNHAYIIEEQVRGMSLRSVVKSEGKLTECVARRVLWETVTALGELHKAGVVHGCISPDNVYLVKSQSETHVKLANYRAITDQPSTLCRQSTYYQAPEVLAGGEVQPASEMYAVGCLAAYLFLGSDPYSPRHCSFTDKSVQEAVSALTVFRADERVTAVQALRLAVFTEGGEMCSDASTVCTDSL